MKVVTAADYSSRIFGFKVEAQVVRMRKGVGWAFCDLIGGCICGDRL